MKSSLLKIALCACAIFLGGCLVSQHEHFNIHSGVAVPLPDGVYACSGEKKKGEQPPMPSEVSRVLFHATTFEGRIHIQKAQMGDNVRYLIASADDPTMAAIYAFHRVAGDVFAYTTPVVVREKNKKEKQVFVVWFVRITDRTIARLQVEDSAETGDLARKFGVQVSADKAVHGMFAFRLKGTKEDERLFIDALAASDRLMTDSVCEKVEVR